MRYTSFLLLSLSLLIFCGAAAADDPKPTADNTITVKPTETPKAQTFPRPVHFAVVNVVDRTGNPQPMLVFKQRGGVFLDRQPTEVVKQAMEDALRANNLLAADPASADFTLTVYLFHFGLASGSGMELFGKADMNVVVKHVASGTSTEVPALGTCIEKVALLKKNIMKNVTANLEKALQDGLRNFLRGNKLREAVESAPAAAPPTSAR